MRKTLASISAALLLLQGPMASIASAEPSLLNVDWNAVILRQRGGHPGGGFGGGGHTGGGGFGGGGAPRGGGVERGGGQQRGGGERGGGGFTPPRQDPPRQQPPRQDPPRRDPPRQDPPRQEPPIGRNPGNGHEGRGGNGGREPGNGGREPGNGGRQPGNGGREPGNGGRGGNGGTLPPVNRGPLPGRGRDGGVPAGHPQAPVDRRPPVFRGPAGGGNGGNNGGNGGGQHTAPARIPQRPQPISSGNMIDRNQRPQDALRNRPTVGRNGQPLTQREWTNSHGRVIPPSQTHITTINNTTVINNITVIQNNWHGGNGYGWYNWGGYDVCHRYWGGYHWWGWYIGPVYFWAPYYAGYWWWWDPYWHRWCWYNDGYWWYQESPTIIYVYNNDNSRYDRYDDSTGGAVTTPDTTPATDTPPPADNPAPAANPNEKAFHSNDGTVTVQVYGDKNAFLYSNANPAKFQPVWLGADVTNVFFRNDANGNLMSILVLSDNGTFNVFDPDGTNQAALSSPANSGATPQAPVEDPNAAPQEEPQQQSFVTMPQNQLKPAALLNRAASFGSLKDARTTGYTW